jgi:molecular chaperone GrpE
VEEHDALLQIPRADVPPQTVVEEVERGYRFNDKVLRHAKVVVSTAPEPATSPEDPGAESDA